MTFVKMPDNKEAEAAAAEASNGVHTSNGGQASSASAAPGTMSLTETCCEGGKAVILNVGGQRHEALRKIFDKFPQSRLWKVIRANTVEEILHHCDRYRVSASNDEVPEYFFDRNYTGFINILDAYRIGSLHLNAENCAVITRDDLSYWGIDELLIEPCCAVKYYPEIEICQNEIDMEEDEKRKTIEREKLEDFGPSFHGKLRKQLWNLFEYPHTSKWAQVTMSNERKKKRQKLL